MTPRTVAFDPARGWPAGPRLRYECVACGVQLPSMPSHAEACRCGNVAIDPDAGRVSVRELAQLRVLKVDA